MSQLPSEIYAATSLPSYPNPSTPGSEIKVQSPAPASTTSGPATKSRSCVICRTRKVRCDRQSPCSNCRRAGIACVAPSTDRPPRWARRLERVANNAKTTPGEAATKDADLGTSKVMERLRTLESLVKDLSGQLEQAHAAAISAGASPSAANSPRGSTHGRDMESQKGSSSAAGVTGVQQQLGRMVVQDASRSRYISSDFWSRINDELDGLKMDTRELAGDESDSSGDEASPGKTPSTGELERTPSERNAFLFRHNLSPADPDFRELHPLPSQIPFLLDVFSENVNMMIQTVHMPTITKMARQLRNNGMAYFIPGNEALMFSIYYAAIASMEEDEVEANFSISKSDLILKYRLGLEHALAKADFLNAPDIVLIQAFSIFLCIVRRNDSPRYVWMMTGLVIRMAQYLGFQRDGTHFKDLSPYETEMRRKVWWVVCALDLRASEDQGTDIAIAVDSYDTKIPSNFNDADIEPETKQIPVEHDGITDMSFARIHFGMCEVMKQMMTVSVKDGAATFDEQSRLLADIYRRFDEGYCQHTTETDSIAYWVGVSVAKLTMAKMTLIVFLPVLFSSPSGGFSDELRNKLLVAGIEVAEYNHALNAEEACRKWRWIFQTYTHWHAIVYLMIDISRRPWSPIVERAWVALHSRWLIPKQTSANKNLRIWVPLKGLMAKAGKHREEELHRLRNDPQAAAILEGADQDIPAPSSSGPFSGGSSVEIFRERWRQLAAAPAEAKIETNAHTAFSTGLGNPLMQSPYPTHSEDPVTNGYSPGFPNLDTDSVSSYISSNGLQADSAGRNADINSYSNLPGRWTDSGTMGPGFVPQLWTASDGIESDPLSSDALSAFNTDQMGIDMNMVLDSEMDWFNWIESAKGMEWDTAPNRMG